MIAEKKHPEEVDAVVVGAGFAGLYMLHVLRDKMKLETRSFDSAEDVGGTWYWNRYPGARCDIPSYDYSYSFSEEIQQEWSWSEKYAGQPEILEYLGFVADKLDLRKNINFNTKVVSSKYNEDSERWTISTDKGHTVVCKYYISGVGALSTATIPQYPGHDSFEGKVYATSTWPHEGVDFRGKTVGIIGTGASAIQAIPLIAKEARHLTVFQRTPNYATPLQNKATDPKEAKAIKSNYKQYRELAKSSIAGVYFPDMKESIFQDSPEERSRHLQKCIDNGGFSLWLGSYGDILFDEKANEIVAEFVRDKISERITNPDIAKLLTPDYLYGTKRQPCETNYFETYNRSNVSLIDIKSSPIKMITNKGLTLSNDSSFEFDILIYSTGFDAFTGPLFNLNVVGRNRARLKDHWKNGPRTNLGIMSHGYPNFFMITGPQSPSVLFNMPLGIEQHVEWIANVIRHMELNNLSSIEPSYEQEEIWRKIVEDTANATQYPKTETWYTGANIPGKPRSFMVYLGGGPAYKEICDDVEKNNYQGFSFTSNNRKRKNIAS